MQIESVRRAWAVLVAWGVVFAVAASAAPKEEPALSQALDVPIVEFHSHHELGMFQMAGHISNVTGLPVLFIQARGPQGKRLSDAPVFHIERQGVTARELLDEAVAADPAYVWFPANSFVNVVPVAMLEDPDSAINRRVEEEVSFEDLSLKEAIQRLQEIAPGDKPLFAGAVTRGPGYPTMEILDRRIDITTAPGPYLEILNAVAEAGGTDVMWLLDALGPLWVGKLWQARPRTLDLAAAEASLQSESPDWDAALKLYQAARQTAPYDEMRTFVDWQLASLYLGNGGRLASAFPTVTPQHDVAVPLLEALVSNRELAVGANVFVQCVDSLAATYYQTGQRNKTREFVDDLLDSENIGHLYRLDHLCQQRIGIEVDSRDLSSSLTRLKALRSQRADNAMFQQELENRIAAVESDSERRSNS